MEFIMSQAVRDLDINFISVVIKGVKNKQTTPEFDIERKARISKLLANLDDSTIDSDPILIGYRDLHKKVGVPRRKNTPASENLIKLLLKNQDLFSVNIVVDLYNIISMESRVALGAHDLKNVSGNINLRMSDGSEKFIPLGQIEPKQVKADEYIYVDDSNEIICRLEIRQVEKTKVTLESEDIWFLIQGNASVSHEHLLNTANKIMDDVTRFCGGEAKITFDSNVN